MTDETREYAQAARALRGAGELAEPHLETAERRIGEAIAGNVRQAARRTRASGRLDRSITSTTKGDGSRAVTRVTAAAPHAHLVAGGTRPHTIRAIRSRALPVKRGSTVVGFAESVRHPGTRPRPFFAEGVDASEADITRVMADTGDAILDDLTLSMRRR